MAPDRRLRRRTATPGGARGNVLRFRDAGAMSASRDSQSTTASRVVPASGWESRSSSQRIRSRIVVPEDDTESWTTQQDAGDADEPENGSSLPPLTDRDSADSDPNDSDPSDSDTDPKPGDDASAGSDADVQDDRADRDAEDLGDLGKAQTKTREEICREQQADCAKTRAKYRNSPISTIGLDITPGYKRGAGNITSAVNEEEKRKKLASAASRTWTNRTGDTVAVGRIQDFRHRQLYIETEDGGVTRLAFEDLGADDLCYFAEIWGIPFECTIGDETLVARNWLPSTFTWKASALCNKPLYFEEMQLERYGHTTLPLVQPALSGAHFFLNVATIPYKVGMSPPHECQYALGYYRPGNCAPWVVRPIPLSLRGALFQAGAVTGGIFVVP